MPDDDPVMNRHKPSIQIAHPSGLARVLFRFPITLYRLHLGWLLGKRALLLEHRGRKTGMIRKAVIEVVDHDVQKGSYIVMAAWGKQADWYQNIEAEPHVNVMVSTKRFAAIARTLPSEEAAQHIHVYATRHPFAFRQLGAYLFGLKTQEPTQFIKSLSETIPLVEFVPAGGKDA